MEADILSEQENIINYTKNILAKIQFAPSAEKKEEYLYNLLAFLISSSNDIAQRGDLYEAAGRLYSAAYYLEEYHTEEAFEIYQEANKYYIKYFRQKIKSGEIHEATNIALKIATLYEDKLNNSDEKKSYLTKAINLIQDQIEILQNLGSSKELCGKFQKLSILLKKSGKWDEIINVAQKTIIFAKTINDYSAIANAYMDIVEAYEHLQKIEEIQNIFYEALDYFLKEASQYEDNQKFLPLSQLYQIVKNFYAELKDWNKFIHYCRKEAGTYVDLAEHTVKNKQSPLQTASYYRGAALCYRECNENLLESASCFFISGDYFFYAKKILEAALNYQDAGKLFEEIGNFEKAYELFSKAGKLSARAGRYRDSIENFIWAFEVCEKISQDQDNILNLLIETLIEYSNREMEDNNYFIAASLKIEALDYTIKYSTIKKSRLVDFLRFAGANYQKFAEDDCQTCFESDQLYALALSALISLVLGDTHDFQTKMVKLEESIQIEGKLYHQLLDSILKSENDEVSISFSQLDVNLAEMYKQSPELVKIVEIVQNSKCF